MLQKCYNKISEKNDKVLSHSTFLKEFVKVYIPLVWFSFFSFDKIGAYIRDIGISCIEIISGTKRVKEISHNK